MISLRAHRASVAACSLVLGIAVASGQSGGENESALDATRDSIAKWVEIQQLIAKEKRDWQLGREVLERRIALLESETSSLREKIVETETSIEETSTARRELERETMELKRATASLSSVIVELERETALLLPRLPEPIAERIKPLSRKLPSDPEATKLSLSQRFQNVIGVLNEINKFNQQVTVTSELRTLPDGSAAEVTALYLGLGQAYYVTSSGDAAGVGRPTEDGWQWDEANELAPRVTRAIAIYRDEEVPGYVPLPVTIR